MISPEHPDTPKAIVHGLLRSATKAVLATVRPPRGAPYASLVLTATSLDARPVLLLSRLAIHTQNIEADPRASLLLDGTGAARDPLTGPRATIEGRLERSTDPALRSRFLRRHPDASAYADFPDFAFYVLAPERAHLVAGFGRIVDLEHGTLVLTGLGPDWQTEAEVVAGLSAATGRAIAGLDPHGIDLLEEGRPTRIGFAGPAATLAEACGIARRLLQR